MAEAAAERLNPGAGAAMAEAAAERQRRRQKRELEDEEEAEEWARKAAREKEESDAKDAQIERIRLADEASKAAVDEARKAEREAAEAYQAAFEAEREAAEAEIKALPDFSSCGLNFNNVREGLLYGCTEHMPDIVKDALANDADVNKMFEGFLPLQHICKFYDKEIRDDGSRGNAGPEILQVLMEAGANVNSQDAGGRTPLWTAIHYSHLELATTLITEYDADVNLCAADEEQDSPLEKACCKGNKPLVALLLEKGASLTSTKIMNSSVPELAEFLAGKNGM